MSPLPRSFSEPTWSRMVRESWRLAVAKEMRQGKFALMVPVSTSTDGLWVATIRWMPTARAIWASRAIEVSTSEEETIRSASSSITTT